MVDGRRDDRQRKFGIVGVQRQLNPVERRTKIVRHPQIDHIALDREAFDWDEEDNVARETVELGRKPLVHCAQVRHSGQVRHSAQVDRDAQNRGETLDGRSQAAQQQLALERRQLAFASRQFGRRHLGNERRRNSRLSGAILELQASQTRVEPSARVQACMGSFLDDPPVVHHDDPVGGSHCR